MSVNQLRQQLMDAIEQMPKHRLEAVSAYVQLLEPKKKPRRGPSDVEKKRATRRLLKDIRDAEEEIKAGKGVEWRKFLATQDA